MTELYHLDFCIDIYSPNTCTLRPLGFPKTKPVIVGVSPLTSKLAKSPKNENLKDYFPHIMNF